MRCNPFEQVEMLVKLALGSWVIYTNQQWHLRMRYVKHVMRLQASRVSSRSSAEAASKAADKPLTKKRKDSVSWLSVYGLFIQIIIVIFGHLRMRYVKHVMRYTGTL